jgi:hypothetical protein
MFTVTLEKVASNVVKGVTLRCVARLVKESRYVA